LIGDPDVRRLCVTMKKKSESIAGGEMDIASATRIKLVVVGDGAVGKTSLLISYATDKFPEEYVPTVFENYTAQMKLNDEAVLLHLWDTAGQEEYDRLRPLSYPGAEVVILCFSLVHKPSYDAIRVKWFPEVRHYIPNVLYILVGTKLDLRDQLIAHPNPDFELVSTEQGQAMCEEIKALKYLEVSAKTKKNLEQVFIDAVTAVMEINGSAKSAPSTASPTSPNAPAYTRPQPHKKACTLL
jgi:small GTP-binding protein